MKTAMILAAGRGQRMRPITDAIPKPLIKVKGKPLIEYHLENLQRAGIDRVVINHSWLGDQIVEYVSQLDDIDMEVLLSAEHAALETAGGIVQALPQLCPDGTETFWTINGDIFCDFNFAELPVDIGENYAHLVMVDNPQHNPSGDFSIENGQLCRGSENKLTYCGIAIYRKAFFSGLKAEVQPLAPLFMNYIDQNQMGGQKHRGNWSDVGTPERLQLLNAGEPQS